MSPNTSAVVVRTQLETGLVTKDYIRPQSKQFLVDWAWHYCNQIWWHASMRDEHHNGQLKCKFSFLSHLPRVMLDLCAGYTVNAWYRWIWCCNTTLKIVLFSHFVVFLDQPLLFWHWYLSLLIHSCHYCLIAASLQPRCGAIVGFIQLAFLHPIKWPLSNSGICNVHKSFTEALL